MNVAILTSSSNKIDAYYLSIARSIANYLASSGFDLVFGGCSTSMMGICYHEFADQGRNIYSFTTQKYTDDIINLEHAKHYIRETTFDLKKSLFENSDLIVALPGGIGTLSEILSFIEENRSNDKKVPIEIYDEDGYYQKLFEMLEVMQENKFLNSNITDFINISHNKEEFLEHINNYIYRKEEFRK